MFNWNVSKGCYQFLRNMGCLSSSLEPGLSEGFSSRQRRVTSLNPGESWGGIEGAVVALAIWKTQTFAAIRTHQTHSYKAQCGAETATECIVTERIVIVLTSPATTVPWRWAPSGWSVSPRSAGAWRRTSRWWRSRRSKRRSSGHTAVPAAPSVHTPRPVLGLWSHSEPNVLSTWSDKCSAYAYPSNRSNAISWRQKGRVRQQLDTFYANSSDCFNQTKLVYVLCFSLRKWMTNQDFLLMFLQLTLNI